jgi:hypothetical protein
MVNDLIYIAYMDPMGNGVPVPNRWTVYFHVDKGKSENQMDDDWGVSPISGHPGSYTNHRDFIIKTGI